MAERADIHVLHGQQPTCVYTRLGYESTNSRDEHRQQPSSLHAQLESRIGSTRQYGPF